MLRIRDGSLPDDAARRLAALQDRVDAEGTYAERVTLAKRMWQNHNRATDRVFSVVRETLDHMCSGARRCGYCEDSYADEIDHIWPKDLYPDKAFLWRNYLYACGPCNGPKGNSFAVFSGGRAIDVGRRVKDPVVPPADGDPLLIDPRVEDPMELLVLDLSGTFFYLPLSHEGSRDYDRADYTIEVLNLNRRDALVRARRNAFGTYRARLAEFASKKAVGTSRQDLQLLVDDLRRTPHATVWAEMKRQSHFYPSLAELFEAVPEAQDW